MKPLQSSSLPSSVKQQPQELKKAEIGKEEGEGKGDNDDEGSGDIRERMDEVSSGAYGVVLLWGLLTSIPCLTTHSWLVISILDPEVREKKSCKYI